MASCWEAIGITPHGGCKDLKCANHEPEAAVGRGKSKYGALTVRGTERTLRKTNFRYPLLETESPHMLDDRDLLLAS